MANRTIKEDEPIDPIQIGDIITLEFLDGSTISDLLAVKHFGSNCNGCAMHFTGVNCYSGWEVKDSEKYGEDFKSMTLCCTKPVLDRESKVNPEFCKFIKLDSLLEDL